VTECLFAGGLELGRLAMSGVSDGLREVADLLRREGRQPTWNLAPELLLECSYRLLATHRCGSVCLARSPVNTFHACK
jgi:hypothetical protein